MQLTWEPVITLDWGTAEATHYVLEKRTLVGTNAGEKVLHAAAASLQPASALNAPVNSAAVKSITAASHRLEAAHRRRMHGENSATGGGGATAGGHYRWIEIYRGDRLHCLDPSTYGSAHLAPASYRVTAWSISAGAGTPGPSLYVHDMKQRGRAVLRSGVNPAVSLSAGAAWLEEEQGGAAGQEGTPTAGRQRPGRPDGGETAGTGVRDLAVKWPTQSWELTALKETAPFEVSATGCLLLIVDFSLTHVAAPHLRRLVSTPRQSRPRAGCSRTSKWNCRRPVRSSHAPAASSGALRAAASRARLP